MNHLLRIAIRLNALSCIGFGVSFALAPDLIGSFLDGVSPVILRWVGIGLALNGFHLVIASFRERIGRLELSYFILGDSLWVLSSIGLVTLVPGVIHSLSAIAATLAVALLVGSFAILQTRWGWNILSQPTS